MSSPFVGEIRLFAFDFAPKGWALCNGQVMAINTNTALFSLLGTSFGGDGVRNFQLPNMQGRTASGQAATPSYVIGNQYGEQTHTLLMTEMPSHNHFASSSATAGSVTSPVNAYPASSAAQPYTASVSAAVYGSTTSAGGSQPHPNQSPLLVVNYCIALQGIFPTRN